MENNICPNCNKNMDIEESGGIWYYVCECGYKKEITNEFNLDSEYEKYYELAHSNE